MATLRWIGNAQAVAQIGYASVYVNDSSTYYAITINDKSVTVLGQSTAALTAAALTAAAAASTEPEFMEITWVLDSDGNITGTANTPGVPFVGTVNCTDGTGKFGYTGGYGTSGPFGYYLENGSNATGPNFWDNSDNWSTGLLPASGDTVYIDNTSVSVLYNISQSGVGPALVSIGANFTGQIGLPQYNSSNPSGTYAEYRPTALTIAAEKLEIGNGSGAGSSLIRIDTYNAACAAIVYGTGSPSGSGAESGVPAVVIDMDSTTATLQVLDGSVGVGVVSKASNVLGTLSIGQATEQASLGPPNFASSGSSSTNVTIGPDVEINSTTNVSAGNVLIDTTGGASLGTSINVYGGTLEVIGTVGITDLNVYAGTCYWSSTGTITSALVGPGGTLDFSQDLQAKTVTDTVQMSAGGTLNDPYSVVSSLAIKAVNCTLAQLTVSMGFNHTFTRS